MGPRVTDTSLWVCHYENVQLCHLSQQTNHPSFALGEECRSVVRSFSQRHVDEF